jgi:hypothetical protein
VLTFWVDPNCTSPCDSTEITAIVCKWELIVNTNDQGVGWRKGIHKARMNFKWNIIKRKWVIKVKFCIPTCSTFIPEENWRWISESSCKKRKFSGKQKLVS